MADVTINLRGLPPRAALRAALLAFGAVAVAPIEALPISERAKNKALSKLPVIVARTRRRAGVR
jgi:hypothetical protein